MVNTEKFYDTDDKINQKTKYGNTFHLSIPSQKECFIQNCQIDQFLNDASYEEIMGFIPKVDTFDSFRYAVQAIQRFRNEDIET